MSKVPRALCTTRLSEESNLAAEFKISNLVYKREPGINKCLEASWDGPFDNTQLLPPVNCAIIPKKTKSKVVHLSQVKRATPVFRTLIIPDEEVEDPIPINITQPVILEPQQQLQLDNVLSSYPSVFSDKPGLTSLVSHSISVTSTTPFWSPPYSVPLAHQEAFRQEIENLL